jgi:Flp pilus assembly protein TadB
MALWPSTVQGKLFVASIAAAALVVWLTGSVVWAIAAVLALTGIAVLVWHRPVRRNAS